METRRDRDACGRDPSDLVDVFRETAAALFGAERTWPPELAAGVHAVAVNPSPSALWWGSPAEVLHGDHDGAAELVALPALTKVVAELQAGATDQPEVSLEVTPWLIRLRVLCPSDGSVAGVLAVACNVSRLLDSFEQAQRADEERVANLLVALQSNREIGTAIGILMARNHLTQSAAFEALRASSQRHHRKLRAVADDVILTGALPDTPPAS